MADYGFSDRVTRERVYRLGLPSNAVELEKMLQAAYRDAAGSGAVPMDDRIRVEADEGAVRLVFDLPPVESSGIRAGARVGVGVEGGVVGGG